MGDYLHHLLAERELRASPKVTTPPPSTLVSSSTTTTLAGGDRAQKRATTQCRYFGKSAKGCMRGRQCPYMHPWEGLEQKERCLACGGKGHLVKECPTRKPQRPKGAPNSSPSSAASPSPTSEWMKARMRSMSRMPRFRNLQRQLPQGHAGGGRQGLEGTFHCPHEVDEDNGPER